jgi:hypothetical protein
MDFVEQFSHVQLLVVVHNFNLVRTVLTPDKAHAPLVVDADAVLPLAVALQGFELVAGRNPQAGQLGGRMQLQQLASRYPFDVLEPGNRLTMG